MSIEIDFSDFLDKVGRKYLRWILKVLFTLILVATCFQIKEVDFTQFMGMVVVLTIIESFLLIYNDYYGKVQETVAS